MKPTFLLASLLSLSALAQEPAADVGRELPPWVGECNRDARAGLAEGPVTFGFYEADVGTGRRACPRTEASVGGRARLIVDTPNFYGNIVFAVLASGSYALDRKTEVFGTLEAWNYQWVQNATLKGASATLGQLTVGATRVMWEHDSILLAPSARLMLPTALAMSTRVVGAEVGVAYQHRLMEKLALHGFGGLGASAGLSSAPAYVRPGALLNFGAQYDFFNGFGVALDLNGHFATRAALDYLAPSLGLRVNVKGVGVELGASVPLFGDDRHLVSGGLRVSYRL